MTSLHILVVDDEAIILMGTESMLRDLGHRVTAVSNVRTALDILQSYATVDVLLSDYEMPGHTGTELAGKARHLRPNIGIILTTGRLGLGDLLEPGWIELLKPFTENELKQALSAAVDITR